LINNKLLVVTLSLILVAGMSEQVWAQSSPIGEMDSIIPTEELSNPNFVPGSGSIFIIQACTGNCVIQEWDPITKLMVNQFLPAGTLNGRGIAFDGTDLWYSGTGDPLIHKVATTGGPDITTIPVPPMPIGIGGLDWDFSSNTLVAVSDRGNAAQGGFQVSVINPANGNLLASCTLAPHNGETFAIAVDPLGNTFWSNPGTQGFTILDEYVLPSIPNQGVCTPTGNSFNPTSVGVAGVDFDVAGSFITVTAFGQGQISDLNGNPLAAPVDSFPTGLLTTDLTTTAVPQVVGGESLSIDSTALVLAAAPQSPSVLLSALTIAALGIGAFVFTRNENNMRNIKVILRDYLDRF